MLKQNNNNLFLSFSCMSHPRPTNRVKGIVQKYELILGSTASAYQLCVLKGVQYIRQYFRPS